CASFTLLAFFSSLTNGGDTVSVAGLHQAWTLFTVGCAVLFFWAAVRQPVWPAATAATVTVLGGWVANVVWYNHFDNELALASMPALAGVVALYGPRDWSRWMLAGALLAGCLATYPEMVPFITGGAFLIALPWLWRERAEWRCWLRGFGAACGLA